jgi:hypothetical protein
VDRFWSKVEKTDGCWNWTSCLNKKGYGNFSVNSRMRRAHRVSYEMHCEPIPPGMLVLHHCDNPRCIRPDHLFLGTNADNMADKVAKGREAHVGVQGVSHPRAKLTEAQVLAIRSMRGPETRIAEKFGISVRSINDIRNRISWRHI